MKVIFTQSVQGVAGKGEVKNVRSGYFRNYLMPFKKAIIASDSALASWEEFRKKMMIEREQLKTQFEELSRRLAGANVKIEKKVTKKGTLYGGVKAKDIAAAVKAQFAIEVPEGAIRLKHELKAAGIHKIPFELADGVMGEVSVEISGKEA